MLCLLTTVMFCGFQLLDDKNFKVWWHCVTLFHTRDFNIYSYNTITHSLMYPNQFSKTCFFVSLLLRSAEGTFSIDTEWRIELGLDFQPADTLLVHVPTDTH